VTAIYKTESRSAGFTDEIGRRAPAPSAVGFGADGRPGSAQELAGLHCCAAAPPEVEVVASPPDPRNKKDARLMSYRCQRPSCCGVVDLSGSDQSSLVVSFAPCFIIIIIIIISSSSSTIQ
jgi:hypothetical protein